MWGWRQQDKPLLLKLALFQEVGKYNMLSSVSLAKIITNSILESFSRRIAIIM
jgi:hypothetical protein